MQLHKCLSHLFEGVCEPEDPDVSTDLLSLCQIWRHGQWPAPTFVCLIAIRRDNRHTLIKDTCAQTPALLFSLKCEVFGFFQLFFILLTAARNPVTAETPCRLCVL